MLEVIYAGNRKVTKMIFLSALSLAYRSGGPITIHLLSMDLSAINPTYEAITREDADEMEGRLRKINPEITVKLYDLTEKYLSQTKYSDKDVHRSYTPYCLLRLFITDIDAIGDKAIYLDIDMMIYKDIRLLFDIDVEGYEIAGVKDAMGKYWINPKYMNSGVMLINVKKIRETRAFEKALKYTLSHRAILIDQNAINHYCKKKKYLPSRFNNQRKMTEDTVIKHFCKVLKFFPYMHCVNIKQTDRERVWNKLKIHEFDDVYRLYDTLIEDKITN